MTHSSTPSTVHTGHLGESFVANDLAENGWQILARNLRTPLGEVDILALDPMGDLVVVEVKSRSPLSWVDGIDALRPRQLARLFRALAWCGQNRGWAGALRLDLAAVVVIGGLPTRWEHIRDLTLET
ncbi:MAG: YraN family protein [Planctomycetes bacterium]|jgi:putative endonuclease|nr:YraN family protein [Planctomycetota bacterium]MBT4561223.1 YraN family protein [Planctomycetota bacterium]MBT5100356.1 YraN family protein [Planctomycetota bacterium]MBT5120783.1 YraN family protein [Planctomycetota bacterium]MBT7012374.1 YraN family protein [Planctomycetota bacterium]